MASDDIAVDLDDSDEDPVQITGSSNMTTESVFERLEAQVMAKHRAAEEKKKRFQTQREVEKVHGRLTTQSAHVLDVMEAEVAARNFSNRNRLKVLDTAKASASASSADMLPSFLTVKMHCPVVNCGMGFTGERSYEEHMNSGEHSPCQPCLHMPDGQVLCDQVAFLCPVCGLLYSTAEECREHMARNDHDVMMKPLRLGAYLCPQCLHLFPSKAICKDHMKATSHWAFSYPFQDDSVAEPQKAPMRFILKFKKACGRVAWRVKCVSCSDVGDIQLVRHHLDKEHVVCANADATPDEVLAQFLKEYTCVQCLRLFDHSYKSADGVHNCGGSIKGFVIENECKTFEEFIRRLCLPVPDRTDTD